MNNIGKNVDSMNFEELRSFVKVLANDVQELSDLYAKTTREYNDMLYNLSRDNLSIEYIQEEKEFVNSTVGDKMKDYSTIDQTDEKIASSVISNKEYVDTSLTQYSTTEQTAEMIQSKVEEEIGNAGGGIDLTQYTRIDQTADAITQTAYRGINLSEAIEISGEEFLPDEYDGNEYFISHDGFGSNSERTYYAYNYALGKYMPILDGQSIYTIFEQTAEGFKFKGDVNIFGVLSGVEYSDIKNEAKLRLSASDSNNNTYPSLVYEEASSNKELFRITYDDAGTVYFLLNSNQVGYVGTDMETFYPVGKWRFSQADVEGLGVVPVFG